MPRLVPPPLLLIGDRAETARRYKGVIDGNLFLGWFGPIGVAALYYANLSVGEAGVEEAWVIGSLIICASILVHGLSATPLTRLYGKLARGE